MFSIIVWPWLDMTVLYYCCGVATIEVGDPEQLVWLCKGVGEAERVFQLRMECLLVCDIIWQLWECSEGGGLLVSVTLPVMAGPVCLHIDMRTEAAVMTIQTSVRPGWHKTSALHTIIVKNHETRYSFQVICSKAIITEQHLSPEECTDINFSDYCYHKNSLSPF